MLRFKTTAKLFFILSICLTSYSKAASALNLSEYLTQVKNDNVGYTASKTNSDSANLLSKKAFLLTTPNLFVSAQTGAERQNQAIAFVRYQQVNTQNYSLGVEQNFSFGLNSKLYYRANRIAYQGLKSTTIQPTYYQTNPVLDLSLPLWKDRFGSTIKAQRDSIYYSNQANKFNSKAEMISSEVSAEKAYWQLIASKKIVEISKESLRSVEKLLQSASKKAIMNLGETADVLQAKTGVETKKLQLKQAENSARIAARNFNQNRYINSDVVNEKLDEIDVKNLEKLSIDRNMPDSRNDIKAQAANIEAAVAKAKIEEEANKPQFDLYGSYGFNGLETKRSDAIYSSLSQQGDNAYIGVKFSMPIAIGLQSDIRQGAKGIARAARMSYRQKVFNQENDWQNLLQNLQDYQENLRLSRKIEALQKTKLENENLLLKRGRTSTYQVLLFEQDYNQAQISTVQNAYQFLSLMADKKNYGLSL